MAEFKEIINKISKAEKELTQTIEKYNKESYSTQSKIREKHLFQSEVSETSSNFSRGH